MQGMSASILVVEDDEQIRKLIEVSLIDADFQVTSVATGEDAIEAFQKSKPTLIVLDIGLPGLDGFTTCQRLRLLTQMPIVMVTGRSGTIDRVWGIEAGADDYITKPFRPNEFVARVNSQLRRIEGRQDVYISPDYTRCRQLMTACAPPA